MEVRLTQICARSIKKEGERTLLCTLGKLEDAADCTDKLSDLGSHSLKEIVEGNSEKEKLETKGPSNPHTFQQSFPVL